MNARPSVLLMSNLSRSRGEAARIEGLEQHVQRGELSGYEVIYCSPNPGEGVETLTRRVVRALTTSRCTHVLALAIQDRLKDMASVREALSDRQVLYWEGDPWGRGKRIAPEMSEWLTLSDFVFSVGGLSQARRLIAHGAKTVHHTIHTYNQVLFRDSELQHWSKPEHKVAFIGSNLSRAPLVSGLPGSAGRWRLVASLKMRFGGDFLVAGNGWPGFLSGGSIPFDEQDQFIQRARVLTNWDHYPTIESYTSDRLAIAMIAGRAQVSTLHPEMGWLPSGEHGLFLEPTVGGVLRRTSELLALPELDVLEQGMAAHRWAYKRVSHREAVRHMLSTAIPEIERPPSDPWDRLPGPWEKDRRGA